MTTKKSDLTCNQILKGIARSVWEKDGNKGEPPAIPTVEALVEYDAYKLGSVIYPLVEKLNTAQEILGKTGPIYQTPELREACDRIIDTVAAEDNFKCTLFDTVAAFGFVDVLIADFAERIERLHSHWQAVRDRGEKKIPHILEPIIREWLKWVIEKMKAEGTRTVKKATVDKAGSLTSAPYVISETIRRQWEAVGSVDTVEVDGEPIVTQISQLPRNHKVFKPKGTAGELIPMPTHRGGMDKPIMLAAYEPFGSELRQAIAPDSAQLLTLAYAVNEPLQLSVRDGASLLARGKDGQLRTPQASDEQRFELAFAAISGLHQWITDERGINRFYPLTACDRLINDRVKIGAAGWASDRSAGRWTLTAGFGVAGQHRLAGNTHANNIWRVIAGVEYWLARERFHISGPHKNISQALVPITGNTGAGQWYTLTWQELMMIAGDVWEWDDQQADTRGYKRFQRMRDALIKHGYQVKGLNTPAEAGDTVEFLFEKRGRVKVRATARFVEAARKASRADWETVNLTDWLGL